MTSNVISNILDSNGFFDITEKSPLTHLICKITPHLPLYSVSPCPSSSGKCWRLSSQKVSSKSLAGADANASTLIPNSSAPTATQRAGDGGRRQELRTEQSQILLHGGVRGRSSCPGREAQADASKGQERRSRLVTLHRRQSQDSPVLLPGFRRPHGDCFRSLSLRLDS